MANENTIGNMLEVAMGKMKEIAGSDTIIGSPIPLDGGGTAVPVSKVSFGFGSLGSEFPGKAEKENFGAGIGGGVTVTPIAFLVSSPDGVRLMQLVDAKGSTTDNLIRTVPELVDKVMSLVKKDKTPEADNSDYDGYGE